MLMHLIFLVWRFFQDQPALIADFFAVRSVILTPAV